MEFKLPYLLAMRQQAPKMFNRLSREGRLMAFVDEKAADFRSRNTIGEVLHEPRDRALEVLTANGVCRHAVADGERRTVLVYRPCFAAFRASTLIRFAILDCFFAFFGSLLVFDLPCNSASATHRKVFSVFAALGFIPRHFKLIVQNDLGTALSTGCSAAYSTVTGYGT